MNLTIRELNELIYSLGIAGIYGSFTNKELSNSLHEKLHDELARKIEVSEMFGFEPDWHDVNTDVPDFIDEEVEDTTSQGGWMYADLFLALMVIFLATISFVPAQTKLPTSASGAITNSVDIKNLNFQTGLVTTYSKFDIKAIYKDVTEFKVKQTALEQGYVQGTIPGQSGVYWIKPDKIQFLK